MQRPQDNVSCLTIVGVPREQLSDLSEKIFAQILPAANLNIEDIRDCIDAYQINLRLHACGNYPAEIFVVITFKLIHCIKPE